MKPVVIRDAVWGDLELEPFLVGFALPSQPSNDATLRVTAHPGDLAGFQALLVRVEHAGGHVTVALLDNQDDRTLGRVALELVQVVLEAR